MRFPTPALSLFSLTFFLAVTPSSAQLPKPADSFIDSIGVATHYNYNDTVYRDMPTIGNKLRDLGVRHIRDGSDRTPVWNEWKRLNTAYGIKVTASFTPASFWAINERVGNNLSMIELLKLYPEIVAGIEGPNEPDVAKCVYVKAGQELTSFAAARAFQTDLYNAVKKDPRIAKLLVLAPPMAHPTNAPKLAPLAAFDIATMHSYAGGNKPSTDLDIKWIPAANKMLPAGKPKLPIVATEAGYHTALGNIGETQPGVSETAHGKYMPRLFAEYFNRGIVRTFAYELIDEGTNQDSSEGNYGLLRNDYSPKPAYTALQNTIALLKDPGPAFTPTTPFSCTLQGANSNLHRMVLQKRTGEIDLVLWQEVPSFNLATKTDIKVAPLSITLKLNAGSWTADVYDPAQSAKPIAHHTNATQCSLSVPDSLLIVKLTPASTPTTQPKPSALPGR